MKSAWRKIEASNVMPGSPGSSSFSAWSTPLVTWTVLAPAAFSMTSSRPGLSFTTASPTSGWWPSLTVATWLSGTVWPSPPLDRDLAPGRRASSIGSTWRMPKPLVGGVDEPAGADDVAEVVVAQQARVERVGRGVHARRRASAGARAACAGSTSTCSCCRRSPQMATLTTPGTRSRRARTFQ